MLFTWRAMFSAVFAVADAMLPCRHFLRGATAERLILRLRAADAADTLIMLARRAMRARPRARDAAAPPMLRRCFAHARAQRSARQHAHTPRVTRGALRAADESGDALQVRQRVPARVYARFAR